MALSHQPGRGNGMDWLTDAKLPIGKWAKWSVDWLTENAAGFFDAIALILEWVNESVLFLLQAPHPFVVVAFAVSLAYFVKRNFGFSCFCFVRSRADYQPGLLERNHRDFVVGSLCILCLYAHRGSDWRYGCTSPMVV